MTPYRSDLIQGDCIKKMQDLYNERGSFVDLIFCDPPYFLSNGGITCQSGKMTKVDKGVWDKSRGIEENHKFNFEWLSLCQKILEKNGTIMVSGTSHVIYSVGFAMQQLGMKILNNITWQKPNPPPNLSCRYFTHSAETIIWAAKNLKAKHTFNYQDMKQLNGGKQMKDVWTMTAPSKKEKELGKHPTQKPVELLKRLICAASNEGALVLDPFNGSGTTGVACLETKRSYIGIEIEKEYFQLSNKRFRAKRQEIGQKQQSKTKTPAKTVLGEKITKKKNSVGRVNANAPSF